jgi:hypothetical protein
VIRKLQSFVLCCAIASATMLTTGCNSQTALSDLEKFGPVITNLLTVACELTTNPMCAAGASVLSDAEKHVFALWQAYIDAQQKGTATEVAWNDLNAALGTLITHSEDVFTLAHVVNGAHQQEVIDMAAATAALLAVIEALLPVNPAAKMMTQAPRLATFRPKATAASGKYDAAWIKQWKKSYNALPAVKAHKMQVGGFWG